MPVYTNALAPRPSNSLAYGPRNLMGTQMLQGPSESYLRQQFPGLYGFLGGVTGTAPDQFQGSVLDPNTAAVRQGAEYGFPVGTALGVSPLGPVALRGAAATGRFVAPKAGQLAEQYMVRTGGILPLDVYHGTPHRLPPTPRNPLGEFDASKIGTGEGAQSYGLGIYTAENPATAIAYAKANRGRGAAADNLLEDLSSGIRVDAMKVLNMKDGFIRQAMLDDLMASNPKDAKILQNISEQKSGNLYKVDLPDEKIAQMIDYDKPMAEQRNLIEKMRKALVGPDSPLSRSQQFQINDYLNDSVRMRNLYPQSVVDLNDPRIVERLRQVGIPGIKYLDEGSRGAEASKQTRNFVTFPGEEQNLRILERNSKTR